MALRMLSLSTVTLLALPLFASAQVLGNSGPFSVSISPQYPAPFSRVTITPVSGQINLTNAIMTVTVDKKQIYQGSAQPLAIPVGAAGVLTTVAVTMTSNGKPSVKTFALRPQDVVIVAEPVSSAPALYLGKPLVPIDGSVRVVAVAGIKDTKGKTVDPAKLSYSWVVDSTRIANSSGIGKDTLLVASPLQYRSREVSVTVQSQDGSVAGGAALSIEPQNPTIRLYENDPLLGVRFDRALASSFSIPGAEKTVYAAPYSFPTTKGTVSLQWFLNGAAAQTGNSITLRPTGTGAGKASLSLVASAGESATATANLSLTFGAVRGGLGIFGL